MCWHYAFTCNVSHPPPPSTGSGHYYIFILQMKKLKHRGQVVCWRSQHPSSWVPLPPGLPVWASMHQRICFFLAPPLGVVSKSARWLDVWEQATSPSLESHWGAFRNTSQLSRARSHADFQRDPHKWPSDYFLKSSLVFTSSPWTPGWPGPCQLDWRLADPKTLLCGRLCPQPDICTNLRSLTTPHCSLGCFSFSF